MYTCDIVPPEWFVNFIFLAYTFLVLSGIIFILYLMMLFHNSFKGD
jgi:hypothetical protein